MRNNTRSVAPLILPFAVTLTMPGSKSHANRAIIAACLSYGRTTIHNATPCDDVVLLVKNMQKMGFNVRFTKKRNGELAVRGGNPLNRKRRRPIELFCGNAGTTTRFLTALACVVPGAFVITGDETMRTRPIGDLVEALRFLGADIEDMGSCPPVRVGTGTISGGRTSLNASQSSQFLTALLLIAPAIPNGLAVELKRRIPSQPYVALTRKVMKDFGVNVRIAKKTFNVSKRARYKSPKHYHIEGDHSAAGAFLVLAELAHSHIRFLNLESSSAQADAELPKVIARMRQKGALSIDCTRIPDQVMNLAALAAFRKGKTTLTGAANLCFKECDRLAVLVQELTKVGIGIQEYEDGLTIQGRAKLKGALLNPHDDHRMTFCFAILGSLHPGIRIKNPDCVRKSYPNFFRDLAILHRSPRPIAIVGMRGVGKSAFGKKLSSALSLKHVDTDRVFERVHGNIRAYIQKKGWMKFRKEEESIVAKCLQPHSVVSLGGGAIESLATRQMLKERAVVMHLQARKSSILERLKMDQRPPLTQLSLEQEVPLTMKQRGPLYENIAHISLKEPHNVRFAIRSLQALCSR